MAKKKSSKTKKEEKPLIFDILTLFPDMFENVFDHSIIKRAQRDKHIRIRVHDLRKWARGKTQDVDDEPYGGGEGMVLKPEPVFKAVDDLKSRYMRLKAATEKDVQHTVLLTPHGAPYNHRIASKLSGLNQVILICGHYEGIDHRVFEHVAEERISIGDYILTGGEIPAMAVVDSVTRLLPGVLGNKASAQDESFSYTHKDLLKYPVYTRPEEYEGHTVPEVLLSGNHKEIEKWRLEKAEEITKKYRPDLLE